MICIIPKVFIVCTGVGHVNRGYESFTIECFENLKNTKEFELILLKGAGRESENQIQIPCVKRNSTTGTLLSKLLKKERYWLEQLTFFFGMLPALIRYKPSVIYYSDFILGTFLWQLRRIFKFKYKLIFCNGAPNGPPFKTEDHVQQLLPLYVSQGLLGGENLLKMTILPYAINIDKNKLPLSVNEIKTLKLKLGLPTDKRIIISIGAVNNFHKRMDYIVDEFSLISNNDFFLLILGQIDEKSDEIINQAENKLPKNSYLIMQVNNSEVIQYLSVSDYFILASLSEGLPRVLPEALGSGLLPIVHDYKVTRETLQEFGIFKNMTQKGILLESINEVNKRNVSKATIIDFAYQKYSWDKLTPKYEELICKNII